ncbi:hypothetical protein JRQ81_017035 [Phrynocephalus forsythii]|uniref:Uncharacterized protein n=1 Tax=Phrynocephalus forsythii TaxID=171643 RepID=A0A9Q1B1P7_9SAUR|nr:hypothetical protein JRQ81_017035 [Phrynocephalus forsythii]
MEKVGAWSLSQSAERMSEALHVSSGLSPRRKADLLNSILLEQKSHTDLKTSSVPSFCDPVSVSSQCSYHEQLPQTLSLTRSRSDNSVIAVSKEALKADVGDKTDYDHQSVESKQSVSGASGIQRGGANTEAPLIQHYTAILVSAVSSDEETIESAGKVSNAENFITSDRVAELLREEGNSLSSSQEMCDGSQDNGRELLGFHLGAEQIKTDSFREVSPDSLNQFTGSGAGSGTDLRLPSRQSSRRSSPLSGKFHSSFEDAPQTSDDREINIEERIPVYLRNLGIDQSPSSILTPFMPRGPVREIELSPTELRTLKASTDMFPQRLQSSEGDSHSVVDALQSSSGSSTVPGGSDPVPTVPPSSKPPCRLPAGGSVSSALPAVSCSCLLLCQLLQWALLRHHPQNRSRHQLPFLLTPVPMRRSHRHLNRCRWTGWCAPRKRDQVKRNCLLALPMKKGMERL